MEKCIRTPQNDNHNEMHNYRNHAITATHKNRSVKLLWVGVTTQLENQKIENIYRFPKKISFLSAEVKNGIFALKKMSVSFCHDSRCSEEVYR